MISAVTDLRWALLTGARAGGCVSSDDGIVGGCTIASNARIERAMGGAGDDTLPSGAGQGIFDCNLAFDIGIGPARDQIQDFSHSQLDKIDFSTIDANVKATGDQAFSFMGGQSFHGIAGDLRYAGGVVMGDTNGGGLAEFETGISKGSALWRRDSVL